MVVSSCCGVCVWCPCMSGDHSIGGVDGCVCLHSDVGVCLHSGVGGCLHSSVGWVWCSHSDMVVVRGGMFSGEFGWCLYQCAVAFADRCLFVKGLGLGLGLGLVFCRFGKVGCRD